MRRRARECALQILYQLDLNQQLQNSAEIQLDSAIADYWQSFDGTVPVDREFSERLARGVVREVGGLDKAISGASRNWKLERMEKVDRNLMRVAAFEMLHCPDIPENVSINEALEIAKRFSATESVPFINGILDGIRDDR